METVDIMKEQTSIQPGLTDSIYQVVTNYLKSSPGANSSELYDFILEVIEPPLFEAIMQHTMGNQVKAAKILGISRGTLRKKLEKYFGEKYFKNKH